MYVAALHCPNPGPIAHGTVQGSFGHGSSVTITCHAGFRLNGAASLRCHAGKWNARIPMCEGRYGEYRKYSRHKEQSQFLS